MSDLDMFVSSLIEEGERRAQEILERAEAEAKAIIEKAEREARERAEREAQIIKNTIYRKLVDARMRQLIMDKIKLKDMKMRAIRQILLKKIKNIVEGKDKRFDYTRILYTLLKRAILELEADKAIVSANSRDLEFIKSHKEEIERRLRDDVGREIEIIVGDKVDILGGVICKEPTGEKISYYTVDGMLEKVLREKLTFIVRRLGMISSNRFKSLIRKLFERIKRKVKIRDALNRDLTLDTCNKISEYIEGGNRVDLVCFGREGGALAVYITLSEVTEERLNHFKKSVENLKEKGVAVDTLLFIAFSGLSDEKLTRRMKEENIYLLTKREIIDLSNKINAGIF